MGSYPFFFHHSYLYRALRGELLKMLLAGQGQLQVSESEDRTSPIGVCAIV